MEQSGCGTDNRLTPLPQELLSLETLQQGQQVLDSRLIYFAFPKQKSPKKAQHEAIPPQSTPENVTTAQPGSASPQERGWNCNSSVKNHEPNVHLPGVQEPRVLPAHLSP